MSYENAEPKILKTLNSEGQVLDDSGNIISDTSDYWVKTYNQAEPKPDKILHSDGTIKDSAGNVIQDTTPFNVKKYNQAEPIPAKYLHADGTIDENPGVAVEPSFDYPSWWIENDELQSIVPDGVKCVARNEGDGTEEIIEGDGVSSLASLINNASNFSTFYATYGESVVFSYSE